MALHRGIQSVVFFYLSCAPCTDARYRKRRKQEAHRDRLDKADLEAQMPNLYRHPLPSSTNPHWQAEIALGPVPTSRGGKRKATPSSEHQRGNGGLKTSGTTSRDGSEVASSTNVGRLRTPDERNDSKYSFGQHQRRDEDQWYSTGGETPLRSFMDGSMPSRPAKAHTKTSSSYLASGNPPINDWHPATVTKVSSREEVAWMLQPPPIAEVMSGKASAYGSQTNSTRSRPSVNSTPVSRQASKRAKEAQVTLGALRDDTKGQRHDRSSGLPSTTEWDFAVSPSKRDKRRPEALHLREASDDSDVTIIHRPLSTPELHPSRQPRTTASRPQLSTILSDSIPPADVDTNTLAPTRKMENSLPSTRVSEASSSERDITARRPAVLISGPSLKILQEVGTTKASLFNTRIFAAAATSPSGGGRGGGGEVGRVGGEPGRGRAGEGREVGGGGPRLTARLPTAVVGGSGEEEGTRSPTGTEMFDSWNIPEFELGEWVHEHTKRPGVKHRWSMDI
ncbi:hypothetical protein LTR91_017791 [Friedmanniomyces endolithicus]|uniref:Uncharacterized protein n=1 Tax=Friedmanniomyces endolithicus TaxID=329885 RepID=A0AAN6J5M0_9PEZI|nr:hypothetical protein LTR35_011878 [Friedmanniomyces endolithicus]KAK0293273.1 hypothetical protein LTS00_007519 [Friedmanniomyces endolithicus]KAK0306896.1 hypothetical protein LTR82_016223 [Friedmanniomyces endolithicus]KAK0915235.1 hypothetical protein LTR57_013618 [Friedmanniomyces endolithicus]KAK0965938.1 hypothetical protein LTR91_017791 [Friedmanniomyces endolithicus]